MRKDKGFSIIEILVALAIAAIAVTIVTLSFSKLNENQALDKSTLAIVSALDQARSMTLSGVYDSNYGVNLQEDKVVIFKGSSYNPSSSDNIVTNIHSLVAVRDINLSGGGSSVVFNRLTGATAQTGSLEIYIRQSSTTYRTIYIRPTGIAEQN